jgi:restriction endonuclease
MKGFNFEKNLTHQTQAVESICSVFENIDLKQPEGTEKNHINPTFNCMWWKARKATKTRNRIFLRLLPVLSMWAISRKLVN